MAIVRNTIKLSSGGSGTEITVVANYSALPDPTTVSGEFYWVEASQGTSWLPGSLGGTYYNSGMYYSNGTAWQFMNVPYQATQAEVNTGTNDDKFVTPSTLSNSTWAFTSAKVLATVLSTLSASSGTFTSSDSLITAFNKTKYLIDNLPTLILNQVLTGFSASAGTVTSSDTILSAFNKIVGNITANTTALDSRVKQIYKTSAPQTLTGTATETSVISFTISANTLTSTDFFRLASILVTKSTATNTTHIRIKVNTTNTFSTATTIATWSLSGTNNFIKGQRDWQIASANIKGLGSTFTASSFGYDYFVGTSTPSTTAFNPAADIYVFVSIENLTSGNSTTIEHILFTN